jgi:hypothetical protein
MSTHGEVLYDLYAPAEGVWSPWVKPVLFAGMGGPAQEGPRDAPLPEVTWAPAARGDAVVVADLEGSAAVDGGLALARLGFRPIPLFNGAPGGMPLVEVGPITAALDRGASTLRELALAPDARPVFLLDALRRAPGKSLSPGHFDNRWMIFPQDFPSATLLLAQGVRRAFVWTPAGRTPADDLVHVLRRWQEAGIALFHHTAALAAPVTYTAPRPNAFRSVFYRALALLGIGRAAVGGFGSRIPVPAEPRSGFYG